MSPADALDAAAIGRGLALRGEAIDVEVLERCTSTNTELMGRTPSASPALLVTDEQTAGRGRRGRRWHASPGAALMFSVRWSFPGEASKLRGLSLATGVSIARTLRGFGASGVALKWPNDLLASMTRPAVACSAKLGGVLIETRSGAGRIVAVIGVGLNCRSTPGLEARLNREVAVLEDLLDPMPARNALLVSIVADLAQALRVFGDAGLAAFRADWESMHAHQGAPLRVRTGDGRVVAGIADGIAADGGLLLRNRRGVHSIHSGTVMRAMRGNGA